MSVCGLLSEHNMYKHCIRDECLLSCPTQTTYRKYITHYTCHHTGHGELPATSVEIKFEIHGEPPVDFLAIQSRRQVVHTVLYNKSWWRQLQQKKSIIDVTAWSRPSGFDCSVLHFAGGNLVFLVSTGTPAMEEHVIPHHSSQCSFLVCLGKYMFYIFGLSSSSKETLSFKASLSHNNLKKSFSSNKMFRFNREIDAWQFVC